jgi:hypothetical protein
MRPMQADPPSSPATRVPALGPRGEGWVVIQVALFGLLALTGTTGPAWSDPWLALGRIVGAALIGLGIAAVALGLVGLRENLTQCQTGRGRPFASTDLPSCATPSA